MTGLNLHLLLPEWFLCATLGVLIVTELLRKNDVIQSDKRISLIPLMGILSAFILTLPFAGKISDAFGGMFLLDPFATFFKAFFALTAIVVIQMSREFFSKAPKQSAEYYLIILCSLIGFFILVSANDLLLLFVSLEVITLSFYILTAYLKNESVSIESGLKYLIMGSLASAVMIFGISLVFVAAGSTSFADLRVGFESGAHPQIFILGWVFILAGLGFKIGAVPFQLWVPDVYEGAPTPVVSFLSVASKAAGFAAILRVAFSVFGTFSHHQILFSVLAVGTLFYGHLGALGQTNIKRLFGYSSIAHAGYLLFGVAAGGIFGTTAVLYYLIAYAVTTLTVFMVLVLVGREMGSYEIGAFRGLAKQSPFLAGIFFLSLLSSAGVPPLAGFSGKFMLFLAAVEARMFAVVFIGALGVAVSLYYYLRIVRIMYFEDAPQYHTFACQKFTKGLLIILALGILTVGIWQAPFYALAQNAARYVF